MPTTNERLRTVCEQIKKSLDGHREHLMLLQKEQARLREAIISLQGAYAALQAVAGETYDTVTLPVDLRIPEDN